MSSEMGVSVGETSAHDANVCFCTARNSSRDERLDEETRRKFHDHREGCVDEWETFQVSWPRILLMNLT